jgi:hypothetical protein
MGKILVVASVACQMAAVGCFIVIVWTSGDSETPFQLSAIFLVAAIVLFVSGIARGMAD